MGHLRWLNGEPAAAEQLLADGVARLDELGLAVEAARARVHLGRCRWELDQPEAAVRDYELARVASGARGPVAELALAYLRIAGIHAFQLDYARCRAAAERPSRSPSRRPPITSACGRSATSRSVTSARLVEFDLLDR